MLIRTKRVLKEWLTRIGVIALIALLCIMNIHRLNNNIYSNYEKATEYGRISEEREIIEPTITAVFYRGKENKKKGISTYLNHFDNYKEKDVKIIIIPPKTTAESFSIIERLYNKMIQSNKIKKIVLLTSDEIDLQSQKDVLQKITHIGNIKTIHFEESDFAEKAENYLQEQGALLIGLVDMSPWLNNDNKNTLIDEIVKIARKHAYIVHVFDAVDTQLIMAADDGYSSIFSFANTKEKNLLLRQKHNLQRYVNQYKDLLLKYFQQNLLLENENETIYPAKSTRTYRLYDRGSVYIRFFGENNKELFSRAKVGKNKGIVVSVIELARKATRKISQPIKSYKIYLFTDFEPLEWQGNDLAKYLEDDDGVYIQYKAKKALMTADERPENQKDILKSLYNRAGVPDDASINDIQLYRFKTVEIENEN